jgi:hypothetical protein
MDEIVKQSWKSWANKWDQENLSDFKKACKDSRVQQEAAIYQRESKERMKKLFEQEQERVKVIQEQKEVEKKD